MSTEQYQKLNDYLNIIFKTLEIRDSFLVNNLEALCDASEQFICLMEQYRLEEKCIVNNLTWEDVYLIARRIILNIHPDYLRWYDDLIRDGTLDFNYQKDDSSSCCISETKKVLINIKRRFNYTDVALLLHEFIHYTNRKLEGMTINRHLLTEFLSIYFEIYAEKYLIANYGVSKDSLEIYDRLNYCKKCASIIQNFSGPLYAYLHSGDLDENSYQFINEYFVSETKEAFERKCHNLFIDMDSCDKKYRMRILYEKEYSEAEFGKFLVRELKIDSSYLYLFGTLLAYYAINYVPVCDIVRLNDFINSFESSKSFILDLLSTIKIDLNNNAIGIALQCIQKELDDKKKIR